MTDKRLLAVGFLAHAIGARFQFHMPYYRLEKEYAGEGLDLSPACSSVRWRAAQSS